MAIFGRKKGSAANDSGVTVMRSGESRRRVSRRLLLVVVIVLILAAGVVAGVLIANKMTNDKLVQKRPKESTTINKLNVLLASGDTKGVEQMVASDKSLSNSREGALDLAAAAVNVGKNDDALKIYMDVAAKYGWTADMAGQVAFIYAGKGDKTQAITYYEKQKTLLDKTDANPIYQAQVQNIDKAIKALQ
jgi:predicted negative regulator of RcsB-dependent stress response